jgi:hypothetical protein
MLKLYIFHSVTMGGGGGWVMVFNATFNDISVILWLSILLLEYLDNIPTCRKLLTNIITYCYIEHTSPERDSNSQR